MKKVTLGDVWRTFWEWVDYRLSLLSQRQISLIIFPTMVLLSWSFLWLFLGSPSVLDVGFPSPLTGAKWGAHQAKVAVCWPIRKAVECCVPGLQSSGETTHVWVINDCSTCGSHRPDTRFVVQAKEIREPQYQVYPKFYYDDQAKTGHHWQTNQMEMELTLSPPETQYVVRGLPEHIAYLTKATYDKVEIGDVIKYCSIGMETGVADQEPKKMKAFFESPPTNSWWMPLYSGDMDRKAWEAMVKPLLDVLNSNDRLEDN